MCEVEFDICVMMCVFMWNENYLFVVDLGLSDIVLLICRIFYLILINLVFKNKKRKICF